MPPYHWHSAKSSSTSQIFQWVSLAAIVFYCPGLADRVPLLWLKLITRWTASLLGFSPSLFYVFPKKSSTLRHLSGISFSHNFLTKKASKISQRLKAIKRNKLKHNICCHFFREEIKCHVFMLAFLSVEYHTSQRIITQYVLVDIADHKTIESFRLEKSFKAIKSNC